MFGGEDNRIIVYNMEMWLKEGDQKITKEKKNPGEQSTEYW